jgi:hypothetical protein
MLAKSVYTHPLPPPPFAEHGRHTRCMENMKFGRWSRSNVIYQRNDAAGELSHCFSLFHNPNMSVNLSANMLFGVNGIVAVITGGGSGSPPMHRFHNMTLM